jgi:hypothetical protein
MSFGLKLVMPQTGQVIDGAGVASVIYAAPLASFASSLP